MSLLTVPCPLCGSQHREDVWTHTTGVTNGMCLDCGHVYLTRQLSDTAIEASYKDYQQSYPDDYLQNESNPLFEAARRRYRLLLDHLPQPPHSLLEIGCGYGHFLSRVDQNCFRAGIEPSHPQAVFARKHFGLTDIWEGSYQSLSQSPPPWPKSGFDVICSFHVLEHVPQPASLLRFAHRWLGEGGYLCLAVPNLFTLSADLIEMFFIYRNWHLHTFTPETLAQLLAREGFEVLSVVEEAPIPMLRSSFVTIARAVVSPTPVRVSPENIKKNHRALKSFHQSLEERLQRVKVAFARWASLHKKVAIYGGGIHTQALLELSGISPAQVKLIIDDDPAKQGKTLDGIAIASFTQALSLGVEVMVVSSLAAEHLILERLAPSAPKHIEIIGIYRDLMGNSLSEAGS